MDTVEKAVLPAASDVVKEKNESAVISGVGGFDRQQLQHVDTVEKSVLPAADDVDIGKAKAVLSGVGEFDRQQLQHVATVEKDVKPDVEVIRKEKSETEVRWVRHAPSLHGCDACGGCCARYDVCYDVYSRCMCVMPAVRVARVVRNNQYDKV